MRKKIVAGNWKMNLLREEALNLFQGIENGVSGNSEVEVMTFVPSLFLYELAKNKKNLILGAQNFHPSEKGAFTGEISVVQIKDANASHVLIGHSERRSLFGETDEFLKEKVISALKHDLVPVFCCGEPLEIRESGKEAEYVKDQLSKGLFHLSPSDFEKCIIAYEPVWAIGTGKTATSNQAEEMHADIRSWIGDKYGADLSSRMSILYGGSCNPGNAKELFACENVDGGLIGGASLETESFLAIANSF